jgi:hypothetical protein
VRQHGINSSPTHPRAQRPPLLPLLVVVMLLLLLQLLAQQATLRLCWRWCLPQTALG